MISLVESLLSWVNWITLVSVTLLIGRSNELLFWYRLILALVQSNFGLIASTSLFCHHLPNDLQSIFPWVLISLQVELMLEFVNFLFWHICGLIALFVTNPLPIAALILVCKDEMTISKVVIVSEKRSSKGVWLSIVFVTEMIVQGKAVISVSCVQVQEQEHEGLGRKRNDGASQGQRTRGVDGLCDYRFDA